MTEDDERDPEKPTPADDEADKRRVTRPTVVLDPRELAEVGSPSWALVMASLERAAPAWGSYALRLGILGLLAECCRAMALPDANKALLAKAHELIDALNRLDWEPR